MATVARSGLKSLFDINVNKSTQFFELQQPYVQKRATLISLSGPDSALSHIFRSSAGLVDLQQAFPSPERHTLLSSGHRRIEWAPRQEVVWETLG